MSIYHKPTWILICFHRLIFYNLIMASSDVSSQKYPAKAHCRNVASYLAKQNHVESNGGAVLYVESAHSRLWPDCDQVCCILAPT